MLEFRAGGGEQLLGEFHVPVHRAADVENSSTLTALRRSGRSRTSRKPRSAVERIVPSRSSSSGRSRPGEAAQRRNATRMVREVSSARSSRSLELALVPDLHRPEVAVAVLADADALGVGAVGAEGRGAGGADPLRAALMAALLLGEALLEGLEQLVPAQGLDLVALLLVEVPLAQLAQPLLGDRLRRDRLAEAGHALEHLPEHPSNLSRLRSSFTSAPATGSRTPRPACRRGLGRGIEQVRYSRRETGTRAARSSVKKSAAMRHQRATRGAGQVPEGSGPGSSLQRSSRGRPKGDARWRARGAPRGAGPRGRMSLERVGGATARSHGCDCRRLRPSKNPGHRSQAMARARPRRRRASRRRL